MLRMNLFQQIASASEQFGFDILVIGGHAVNAYGYFRTTLDVDFMIQESDLPTLRRELEKIGYQWRGQTLSFAQFFPVTGTSAAFPVDLMLVDDDTFDKIGRSSEARMKTLILPEIPPDDSPSDWPEPSWEVQLAHARLLLSWKDEAFFEERRLMMNPEPFRLD